MPVHALNHFTIMSRDFEATREFYCGVLGLAEGPRPNMDFPGLWLYAAGVPILHVMGADEAMNTRKTAIDHVAFSAVNLLGIVDAFNVRGIKYSLRKAEDRGWQLFCRDPDGALIELDFGAAEAAPD